MRIVDFTHVLAGPFATRVLADLGAEVLKVQTDVRAQGAHGNPYPYFAMWNRSKSSITLNMSDPTGGRGAAPAGRSESDVVVENFSAGVLDEWGAGWSELSSWNERIIYLSMHGAGEDGPWRDFVTFAPTVHALAGVTAISGPRGRIECGPGVALNDHVSGLTGAIAVLAALETRRRTGRGQHIDLSQLEMASYLIGPAFIDWRANGREALAAGHPRRVHRSGAERCRASPATAPGWRSRRATTPTGRAWRRSSTHRATSPPWTPAGRRRAEVHDAARHVGRATPGRRGRRGAAGRRRARGEGAGRLAPHGRGPAAAPPGHVHRRAERPVRRAAHRALPRRRCATLGGEELTLEYRASPYFGEHTFEVYAGLLGMDEVEIAERMGDGLFA